MFSGLQTPNPHQGWCACPLHALVVVAVAAKHRRQSERQCTRAVTPLAIKDAVSIQSVVAGDMQIIVYCFESNYCKCITLEDESESCDISDLLFSQLQDRFGICPCAAHLFSKKSSFKAAWFFLITTSLRRAPQKTSSSYDSSSLCMSPLSSQPDYCGRTGGGRR